MELKEINERLTNSGYKSKSFDRYTQFVIKLENGCVVILSQKNDKFAKIEVQGKSELRYELKQILGVE